MRPWLRILLWSLAFWAVWLGIVGLAMTVHGDCGVGSTAAEAAACVREKARLAVFATALGALLYAFALWLVVRRSRGR